MIELLQLDRVSKNFGSTAAARCVSLAMDDGEILCLLGPSGCGKTTILRMIAGFETPDEGAILFRGEDVVRRSPQERQFGMVFQSYALFPHMNVFENVAFGLKVRGLPGAQIASRVRQALDLVQLGAKSARRIQQLSGGEQQRVAVARAIVIEPRLLLLDEPLSNLDASLRESTRTQLRQLIRDLKIGALFVTHDQDEAFALGDRVAVLNAGQLQQIGPPAEIYDQPANLFVARFVGRSNVLPVQTRQGADDFLVEGRTWRARTPAPLSGDMLAVFRPERASLGGATENTAFVDVRDVQRTVHGVSVRTRLQEQDVELRLSADTAREAGGNVAAGARLAIHVPPSAVSLFPHE